MIQQYDLDITHIIKEDMEWWSNKFEQQRFTIEKRCFNVKHMKSKWSEYKNGNGFFVLSC